MEPTESEKSLSSIFNEAFEMYNSLNACTEPTNGEAVQNKIKTNIKLFEEATRLVSLASLFSSNENIDEIPTSNLQYFLLPALLGMLKLKICGGDRKELLDAAEVYFKDFLLRAYQYGLTEVNVNDYKKEIAVRTHESEKSEIEIIKRLVMSRQNKIQRFQEGKELESKLKDLKNCLDEEIKREYYITLIKFYVHQITDELNGIDMERPMLEMFNARKQQLESEVKPKRQNAQRPPPLQPFIITKDDVQKAIFGAGYPSLPTMTVQEFYDKRVQDGVFPDPNTVKQTQNMSLQERALAGIEDDDDADRAKEDEQEDRDDPELLERLRRRDEMKDEFRRGYGNRMNRS